MNPASSSPDLSEGESIPVKNRGVGRKESPSFALSRRANREEGEEVKQGVKSEREMSVLKDFKHIFPFLPESPLLWESAGLLSYRLRRKGITVGLSDCLIAVSAQEADASLYTLDTHFGRIKEEAGISLLAE